MSYTYNITTDRGKTRFHATDTDMARPIWEDAEVDYALELTGNNPLLSAAVLLETAATDAAKIAVITKNDNQSTDPTKMPEMLQGRAAALRTQAASVTTGGTLVADRVPIFQPNVSETDPGNLEPW